MRSVVEGHASHPNGAPTYAAWASGAFVVGQKRARELSEATARRYLGKLQPKAADPNGT